MKSKKMILSSLTVASLLASGTSAAHYAQNSDTSTTDISTSHDDGCGEGTCGTDDDKKDEKKDEKKGEK